MMGNTVLIPKYAVDGGAPKYLGYQNYSLVNIEEPLWELLKTRPSHYVGDFDITEFLSPEGAPNMRIIPNHVFNRLHADLSKMM